jgi:hypothetical protein
MEVAEVYFDLWGLYQTICIKKVVIKNMIIRNGSEE